MSDLASYPVPNVGTRVLYRHMHPTTGEIRDVPAVVVRVWGPQMVNLRVFFDGSNDIPNHTSIDDWKTSVNYSEYPVGRSWHWDMQSIAFETVSVQDVKEAVLYQTLQIVREEVEKPL